VVRAAAWLMPEISRFYGIIIRMYEEFDSRHLPHFHARYGEFEASFDLETSRVLAGRVPARQARLIVRWSELHRAELRENWRRLQSGQTRVPVDPLE
jgi:hypothetical protein